MVECYLDLLAHVTPSISEMHHFPSTFVQVFSFSKNCMGNGLTAKYKIAQLQNSS